MLLVCVDAQSKWPEGAIMKSTTTTKTKLYSRGKEMLCFGLYCFPSLQVQCLMGNPDVISVLAGPAKNKARRYVKLRTSTI